MITRLALAIAAVLTPLSVFAADIPVSYLVEEKPLKAAVAGTPLTFSLYSDDTCTALEQSQVVDISDVTLLTRLKLFKPKKDTKRPNIVEVRTTLSGATGGGSAYLKVIGPGIVPVSSACQAQSASLASAKLTVIDNAGLVVGPAVRNIGPGVAGGGVEVFLSDGVHAGSVWLASSVLLDDPCGANRLVPRDSTVYYASADCTGIAYISEATAHLGPTLYVAKGPATVEETNSHRRRNGDTCPCTRQTTQTLLFPAAGLDTSIYTGPFRIEWR